jgi:hypothetical protein
VIANVIARAKRQAVKREVTEQDPSRQGVRLQDLHEAIRQEFEENKEQLALHKVQSELGHAQEEVQSVDVILQTGESDPWSEEKLRPYRAPGPGHEDRTPQASVGARI